MKAHQRIVLRCELGHSFRAVSAREGEPCPHCGLPLEASTPPPPGQLMLTPDEHDMLANSERCTGCGHLEVLHVDGEHGRRCLVFAGGAGCSCI